MLHINIVCVGKLKEKYLQDAISEYSKRLTKYCSLSITELPDEKLPNNLSDSLINIIKEKESDNIMSHTEKNSYIIALDLHGKQFSSEEFSEKIMNISTNSSSTITFIIGGTLGLSDKLLLVSNELICFSKMTFPHQLIRVFLLEQLFRAFKISNNETYHR
ncbi:MAG: 23S rRNA (pseudouridine(1915)-N(3))-methyltransferase RlmH [Clostridia bacterium]|nr:23S rRNA (pseudouridine(1915)-N(3))-methyltransferase RlmH [Clostridia bacterium]MBR3199463.1 23S rRNA (pseudouridine(1915)-N(3))-methyltransferase RlmH [Bacilli bacterium]